MNDKYFNLESIDLTASDRHYVEVEFYIDEETEAAIAIKVEYEGIEDENFTSELSGPYVEATGSVAGINLDLGSFTAPADGTEVELKGDFDSETGVFTVLVLEQQGS